MKQVRGKTIFMLLVIMSVMIWAHQVTYGETVTDVCMENVAGFGLNCTSNDVSLAGVAKDTDGNDLIDITDPCDYPGDTVTFRATFEVRLNAQERHDIGIYFSTDGEPDGNARTGSQCSITTLDLSDSMNLDLDGTNDPYPGEHKSSDIQDECGDIDAAHNPLFPNITITATCIDTDGDGFLNLPYCTSWRQPGANELCVRPLDAFPGAPSKCKCDDGFNVPVPVPPATLKVAKTADPTSLTEPGGLVTYAVSVTNTGVDPDNGVTLYSLDDSIYGDITFVHDDIISTTCSVTNNTIQADDSNPGGIDTYTCSFTVDVKGNGNDVITDIVTASGEDERGNIITGEDDATVTINDIQGNIVVLKTANPTSVLEPGDDVTFTVKVTNNSVSSDPVTIDSLTDSIYGNLNGQGNCSVPQTLASEGGTYSCSFTAYVDGNTGDIETDIVTASGTDDEGSPVSASDSASVSVNDVPSNIELIKTADPTTVEEPGGSVTYSFKITNTSTVDGVTINSLTDNILGNLDEQGDCSVPHTLAPGDIYSCEVITEVTGNASDSVTNTAIASGEDDDGNEVSASDSDTVDITNVAPRASLTKTVTGALVTYTVVVCNDSDAEELYLDDLSDDIYGNIANVQGDIEQTTCSVPQTLQPSGEDDDCYTCSFEAWTDESKTDTVTATVNDDDGSNPAKPDDSATVTFE